MLGGGGVLGDWFKDFWRFFKGCNEFMECKVLVGSFWVNKDVSMELLFRKIWEGEFLEWISVGGFLYVGCLLCCMLGGMVVGIEFICLGLRFFVDLV